nr:FAD:protein FMN transferase [Streptomyces sp. NBC_01763]
MTGAPLRHVEHVMGTVFSFDIREAGSGARRDAVQDALRCAVERLHRIDELFSTYRADSQIGRFDRGELTLDACEPEVAEVLQACAAAGRETGGWFSPRPADRLDPSGYVKGWSVEQASHLLREAGSVRHSITGGGDVQTVGGPAPGRPWRIGVAHPQRPGLLATVVAGQDLAVATSGTAERGAHILDPHTGRPATALASLTVLGTGLTRTDVWATAGFAMGPDCLDTMETVDGLEALAMLPDGSRRWTSGFPAYAAAPLTTTDPADWRSAVPLYPGIR